jgi:hypothetical protein
VLVLGVFSTLQVTVVAGAAAGAETTDWYSCPDSTKLNLGKGNMFDGVSPHVRRPTAGAVTSADLAAHARLSSASYEMYDAFVAGGDPLSKLTAPLRPFALIYGDPGPDERIQRPNAKDTRTFYGIVADEPSTARRLIILRGTQQPNEWMRNIQAGLRPFGRDGQRRRLEAFRTAARVHAGFLKIFDSLELASLSDDRRTPLADALPELVYGREVAFIGHSLGGALATLAGVEAARGAPADASRMRIVTFASPRIGNRGFAELAGAVGRIDRVCNVVDLVTAAPPGTEGGYVHVGGVFRVSPFDWPRLDNRYPNNEQQVNCWHSIATYAYMIDPDKSADRLGNCRTP